jgi:uncharacterized SAM-binding protein YcdF (DUF218 family)
MFYALLLDLLNPIAVALCLAALARLVRRPRPKRLLTACALAVLVLGSNGWVATAVLSRLELQYLPPARGTTADAIVVLGGGERKRLSPRPSLDLKDGGDRLVHGAMLFRQGAAPRVVCTAGDVASEMADFLVDLGVPNDAITRDTASYDTHDHAVTLCPLFRRQGITRILLVTSASHMPRSVAVFRRSCPDLEVVPAPTDYRRPPNPDDTWPGGLVTLVPSTSAAEHITDALHEYVGMAYYRLRGWM